MYNNIDLDSLCHDTEKDTPLDWLTTEIDILGLYGRPSPNLPRGDRGLILVPSDC